MAKDEETLKSLESFKEEFGRVLDPVAFIEEKNAELCKTFLKLHEMTVNDGDISRKHKLLMHAAITSALHDPEATAMHLTGAIRAGATENELLETAFTIIPVAGMPSFAVFLLAWKKASQQSTE